VPLSTGTETTVGSVSRDAGRVLYTTELRIDPR